MKNPLTVARAKLTLMILSRGEKAENVSIPIIPKVWEFFRNTKDEWVSIEFPKEESTVGCLYKGKKGSLFPAHKHYDSVEHFVVTNKGGKVRVVTDTQIREISFPNSGYLPCGKPHAFEFLEDTEIMIMWHPKQEGWDAEFLKQEEKCKEKKSLKS